MTTNIRDQIKKEFEEKFAGMVKEKKLRKLWFTVSWNDDPTTFQWMVEMDMNKWFKFVELGNGRIGFTQIEDKDHD